MRNRIDFAAPVSRTKKRVLPRAFSCCEKKVDTKTRTGVTGSLHGVDAARGRRPEAFDVVLDVVARGCGVTILTQTSGGVTRRCDGTCHYARHASCRCVCGGRYHGKANDAQEQLTRDWLGDDWRETKAAVEAAGGSFEAVLAQALEAASSSARLAH